jgi:hypothetical protein
MVPTLSPGGGRWRVLPPSMSVEIGSSIRWIGSNESGFGMKDAIGHAGSAMLVPADVGDRAAPRSDYRANKTRLVRRMVKKLAEMPKEPFTLSHSF